MAANDYRKLNRPPQPTGRGIATQNRITLELREKAKELDCDPFEILIYFAKGDWKALGYDEPVVSKWTNAGIEYEEHVIQPAMRLKAASDAAQYIYPKRKAIDVTQMLSEDEKSLIEEYRERLATLEKNLKDGVIDVPTEGQPLERLPQEES